MEICKNCRPKDNTGSRKSARKVINLLHRGVRFTPTQPDVIRIEKLMLAELQEAGTINDKEASAERNGKKGNQQRYASAYHNEADKSPTHISA